MKRLSIMHDGFVLVPFQHIKGLEAREYDSPDAPIIGQGQWLLPGGETTTSQDHAERVGERLLLLGAAKAIPVHGIDRRAANTKTKASRNKS